MPNEKHIRIVASPHPGLLDVRAHQGAHVIGKIRAFRTGHTVHIEQIHVENDFRTHGVGSSMIEKMEKWAKRTRAHQIIRIASFCDEESLSAWWKTIGFFRKRGYTFWGVAVTKKLR